MTPFYEREVPKLQNESFKSQLQDMGIRYLKIFFFFCFVVCLQLVFLQTGSGVALSFSGLLWMGHLYIRREKEDRKIKLCRI